jgi:membrane-anchored mycosin MYCP
MTQATERKFEELPFSPSVKLSHRTDQLVVDLQHVELVRNYLNGLGISTEYVAEGDGGEKSLVDADPALGLARVRELKDADGAVEVDIVLALLRQRIAAERDGWIPVMGKNRFVDSDVVYAAGTKPMSYEVPTPVEAGQSAPASTAASTAGQGIRIGLVDAPLTKPAVDTFPENSDDLPAFSGHARFVRSLIVREAPGATIIENDLPGTLGQADCWDTARAIMQVAQQQIDILNLSLGCYAPGGPPLVISRAIERLAPQVLVVAAAGNHGNFAVWRRNRDAHSGIWPGTLDQVNSVGAVDDQQELADFSPRAPWVTCTAPGVGVIGDYLDDAPFHGCARWSGTSFAAATVSGAIAAKMSESGLTAHEAFASLLEHPGETGIKKSALAP